MNAKRRFPLEHTGAGDRARRHALCAMASLGAVLLALAGCVSVEVGRDAGAQRVHLLHDPGAAVAASARSTALVPALLIQPAPGSAVADTQAIAYSRRPHELAFYQLASWNDRPVRQVPQLLQQRLEASGLAGAVGMVGDPLSADWLLSVRVDRLEHDVAVEPGVARVQLTVELYDRRRSGVLRRQRFSATAPVAAADSGAAVSAMSQALASNFDALLPWLQEQWTSPAPQAPRP